MSHNYPYRRLQPDSDLRPDPGRYSSSDRRHTSPDHDYRQPQESFSSSSSSRGAQWSQDGALSILNSCGLEPSDLALLAELPEDVLTVESLPQVLQQIKGKRGTVKPYAPTALSPSSFSSSSHYSHSSARRTTVNPPASDWDHARNPLLKPLMDQSTPSPLSSDLDRWGNPRTSGSVRANPPSSSSDQVTPSPLSSDLDRWGNPRTYGSVRANPPSSSSDQVTPSPLSSDLDRWGNPRTYGSVRANPPSSSSDQVTPSPLSSDLDRWGNPRTYVSVRANTASSSSSSTSGYMVDFHHRPMPPEHSNAGGDAGPVLSQDFHHDTGSSKYGKAGKVTGPVSSHDRPSFSLAGGGKRISNLSQPEPTNYMSAPPPEEYHLSTRRGHRDLETSSTRSSSRPTTSMPSEREAMDFHGTCPPVFPYSCSLCDITVMSEKVWIKHINGTQHADGQLSLLQQFPNWDCRMETVRADNQAEKQKDEGKPARQPPTATSQPNKKVPKQTSEKGKVVCVKFPAQSVDEMYLRKLVEPFGKIIKILMFPSLAFVELGTIDQAKDLVKFHGNYPPTVNGQQMEFRISQTFSFLQSSQVVSFMPAPTGENGQSDLISIVKRFGMPLYTLFLPSKAFVEMKNIPDAQKLVDYYSSNTLRINNDIIKVSFSGEYKSLMRVASAKRYEEETTKRKRSSSPEKEDKSVESKRRRSSKEEENWEGRERKTRTRSRSKDKSTKEKTTRSRSKDRGTRTRSKSREKSKEKSSREKRSRSRDQFGRDRRTRTRSQSKEKSSRETRSRSASTSGGKSATPDKMEPKASVGDSKPEAKEKEPTAEEARSSAEESDIEGMEVIGEDGENLEDEGMETLDDADVEEEDEEDKVEVPEEDGCPAARTDSSDKAKEKEVMEGEPEKKREKENSMNTTHEEEEKQPADTQLEDEEEEADFPVDLENCITLDELEEDHSDQDEDVQHRPKSSSKQVVYFENLPLHSFSNIEFIKLVRDFGTAVRYFYKAPSCGFIEMSTSSEALRAVEELNKKPLIFKGSRLIIQMSDEYRRLSNGWEVHLDWDSDKETRSEHQSQSSRGSERHNGDESNRKPGGKEAFSKKIQEEDSEKTTKKELTSERTSGKEPKSKKTLERESASKKARAKSSEKASVLRYTPESKALEEESVGKSLSEETSRTKAENESVTKMSEKDSVTEANSKKESVSKRSPGKESYETSEKSCSVTAEESGSEQTDEKKDSAMTVSAAKKPSEKESLPRTSEENEMLEQKETRENYWVPEQKKESPNDETRRKQELEAVEASEEQKLQKEGSEEDTCGPGLKDSESPDRPNFTDDPPRSQPDQKPAAGDDLLQDSDVQVEQQSGPAEGAAELQKPIKPVGTEFVRPVVGYFCNLCQLIYADEDEAKLQHCSSLMHYRKYQEKMGKDPWAS